MPSLLSPSLSLSPSLLPLLRLPLLLVSFLLLSLLPSTSAQTFYSFCYFQQNTLQTSPYLPWSVYAQGTFSLTATATSGLYTVTGITGFREAYVQGKALQTNQILGVTSPYAYGDNDQVLSTTSPYLIAPHAISFYLDGIAQFAQGPAVYRGYPSGSANVSIEAFGEYSETYGAYVPGHFAESDNPPNDTISNVISSGFQIAPATSFVNSYAGCTLTRPTAPVIPQATLTAYNTPLTWPMCYQFQSGANNVGANAYLTTVSGVITTRGYQGTSPSGALTGYLAYNVTGTRNYTVQSNFLNVQGSQYIIQLVGIGGPQAPYMNYPGYKSTTTWRNYANNVLYPTFPQIDAWGMSFLANTSVIDEYIATGAATGAIGNYISTAQSATTEFTLYTDGSYEIYDVIFTRATNTSSAVEDQNWADTLNVQTQAQYNALVPATYKTMAAWTEGVCGNTYAVNPTRYSFCWYVDNSNASIPAAQRGVSYTYGVMTAKTGLTRYGRAAMQLQGMTGVRTVFSSVTNTAQSFSLVELNAPNGLYETYLNQGVFWLTDNVLFTSYPWLSEAGLALTFAHYLNITYPANQPSVTSYLNLYSTWSTSPGPYGITEYAMGDTAFPHTTYFTGQSVSNFNYTPYVAGQVASCGLSDNKVAEDVIAFSFCWFRQSGSATASGYLNQMSAVVYAYSQPVYRNGRPGYVVQTLVGLRTYADIHGFVQSDTITGLSGDSVATSFAGFNAEFTRGTYNSAYDNLIFDSAPHLSKGGILYQVNGLLADYQLANTATISGNGYALDSIGRLWFDEGGAVFGSAAPYNYYDESLYNISTTVNATTGAVTTGTWAYIDLTGSYSNVKIIRDGGASANAGTAIQQCNAPGWMLYGFSYTLYQNLASSPYLPWQVYVSGYLNVSTQSGTYWSGGPGFKVFNVVGTRTIQYGGNTYTNAIIGAAPQLAWNWNDNEINLGSPFFSSLHVLSYQLNGTAHYPAGPIPGLVGANSTYVSLSNFSSTYSTYGSGIQEMDAGLNDHSVQNITSQWDIRLCPNFTNLATCGYTSPFTYTPITYDPAALAAYNTRSQVSVCYTLTAGPGGYGNDARGVYQTVITAILTVTGWGTVSGRSAGLVVGGTGTRTYYFPDGVTNSTVAIQVAGINAAIHAFPNFFITSGYTYASDNVLYSSHPQLDARGLQWIGASDFFDNQESGDYHSNVDRIFWSGYDWREWNTDFSLIGRTNGITYFNFAGNALFLPTTNGADLTSNGAQCSLQWGNPSMLSFCYYLNNTGISTNPYVVYVNGIMNVLGPQQRYGRDALAVVGMTGLRTIAFPQNGSSFSQNIINVEYPNEDTFVQGGGTNIWITDNLVFPSGVPEVSVNGLSYSTATPPIMPAGASGADIIVSTDGLASGNRLYEEIGNENYAAYSTSYSFKTLPYTPGAALVSCESAALGVPAPPSLYAYDFCYALNGVQNYSGCVYTITTTGTVTVYNLPVTVAGRSGYPVANITGTRTYTDASGLTYSATITGLSEDWQAGQYGIPNDQLFFPTSTPNVDSIGLLFKYSGTVNNQQTNLPTNFDRIIRLFSNATFPMVEEAWNVTNATSTYAARFMTQGSGLVVGAVGSVSAGQCQAKLAVLSGGTCVALGGGGTGGGDGGGGGGSGLSGGAIAGIVVGTSVGALLFCVLCFCLGMYGFAGKKKGGDGEKGSTNSRYDSHEDVSKVGQSQVELQTAETNEELA